MLFNRFRPARASCDFCCGGGGNRVYNGCRGGGGKAYNICGGGVTSIKINYKRDQICSLQLSKTKLLKRVDFQRNKSDTCF